MDNVYLSKDTVQNELTDESTDIIIIADGGLERLIASDSNDKKLEKLKRLYDQTTSIERVEDDAPNYNINVYPFSILLQNSWDNIIDVEQIMIRLRPHTN